MKWHAAVASTLLLVACSSGDVETYTLYRASTIDAGMRIHVATFDAEEPMPYNRLNCETARVLFQSQPGVAVPYWCEKGRFKK